MNTITEDEAFERLPNTDDYIAFIEDPDKQAWMRAMNAKLLEEPWPITCLLLELLWDVERAKISIESMKQDVARFVPWK